MKTKLKCLLGCALCGLLLSGCCTSHQARQWEYKVIATNANANTAGSVESQEAILNDQGKQGWMFVQNEGGWFYFKRVKR